MGRLVQHKLGEFFETQDSGCDKKLWSESPDQSPELCGSYSDPRSTPAGDCSRQARKAQRQGRAHASYTSPDALSDRAQPGLRAAPEHAARALENLIPESDLDYPSREIPTGRKRSAIVSKSISWPGAGAAGVHREIGKESISVCHEGPPQYSVSPG